MGDQDKLKKEKMDLQFLKKAAKMLKKQLDLYNKDIIYTEKIIKKLKNELKS